MDTKYYVNDRLIKRVDEEELLNKLCEFRTFGNVEYMISSVNTKCDHDRWSQDVELVKTIRNI